MIDLLPIIGFLSIVFALYIAGCKVSEFVYDTKKNIRSLKYDIKILEYTFENLEEKIKQLRIDTASTINELKKEQNENNKL